MPEAEAPILARVALRTDGEPGPTLLARGGFHEATQMYVFYGELIDTPAGQEHLYQVPDQDGMLDLFPEFEDLDLLQGCDANGVPSRVEERLLDALGFSGVTRFDKELASLVVRTSSEEMDLLYIDAMRAVQPTDAERTSYPSFQSAVEVVRAFIDAQRSRWAGEAASAIDAHDLASFT